VANFSWIYKLIRDKIIRRQISLRIDHIAIAVKDLEPALMNFKNVLNINHVDLEDVPAEKVKVAILKLEDTRIELLQPLDDNSPISKFLIEKGEGIHHLAITADDIEKDVERASSNGAKTLGGIRSGSYGRKITFIHPKSVNGVLMEICQAPPES
jgi:methylmalonyl-CoA/ethylmalonyl-CoA epimerase